MSMDHAAIPLFGNADPGRPGDAHDRPAATLRAMLRLYALLPDEHVVTQVSVLLSLPAGPGPHRGVRGAVAGVPHRRPGCAAPRARRGVRRPRRRAPAAATWRSSTRRPMSTWTRCARAARGAPGFRPRQRRSAAARGRLRLRAWLPSTRRSTPRPCSRRSICFPAGRTDRRGPGRGWRRTHWTRPWSGVRSGGGLRRRRAMAVAQLLTASRPRHVRELSAFRIAAPRSPRGSGSASPPTGGYARLELLDRGGWAGGRGRA